MMPFDWIFLRILNTTSETFARSRFGPFDIRTRWPMFNAVITAEVLKSISATISKANVIGAHVGARVPHVDSLHVQIFGCIYV